MTAVVLYSPQEARKASAHIKRRLAAVSNDVAVIKDELATFDRSEGWRALGYRSMARYIVEHLGMSRPNAYKTLDVVRAQMALEVSRSDTGVKEKSVSQREAARMQAPLKQKRQKRRMPDKTLLINAVSTAIDNFEAKSEGYEDEEVAAYLTTDERRALERAVTKANAFAEHWADLLTRPVERRYIEQPA